MYRYTQSGSIIRESDGACIPPDPNNTDYANLMKSIALGADIKIEPYVAPPPEPQKETLDSQIELLKSALLEAKVLTPEQLQRKR